MGGLHPNSKDQPHLKQTLETLSYPCCFCWTVSEPLLKYIWDNHLIDAKTNTLLGDGKDDSKMLRAVVANPRMTQLIDRHEKQILHLLTETRARPRLSSVFFHSLHSFSACFASAQLSLLTHAAIRKRRSRVCVALRVP